MNCLALMNTFNADDFISLFNAVTLYAFHNLFLSRSSQTTVTFDIKIRLIFCISFAVVLAFLHFSSKTKLVIRNS